MDNYIYRCLYIENWTIIRTVIVSIEANHKVYQTLYTMKHHSFTKFSKIEEIQKHISTLANFFDSKHPNIIYKYITFVNCHIVVHQCLIH